MLDYYVVVADYFVLVAGKAVLPSNDIILKVHVASGGLSCSVSICLQELSRFLLLGCLSIG